MTVKNYAVNWLLQGVGKKDLNTGDTVKLDDAMPATAELIKSKVITEIAEPEKKAEA